MKLNLITLLAALLLAAPAMAQPEPVEVDIEPEDAESLEDLSTIDNPFAGRQGLDVDAAVPTDAVLKPITGVEAKGKKGEGSLLDELMARVENEAVEGWAAPARPRWPYVEWHGYFRFRADLMGRLDLGTYSPVVDAGTSR